MAIRSSFVNWSIVTNSGFIVSLSESSRIQRTLKRSFKRPLSAPIATSTDFEVTRNSTLGSRQSRSTTLGDGFDRGVPTLYISIDGGDEYEVSEPMQIVAKELSPLDLAERAEIRTVILDSLNVLAPGYRAVVLLRDLEGLSTANTAKSLGISIAATKARLYRARRLLRKELQMLLSLDPIRMISVKPQARRDCNSCLQEKGRDQSSPHVSSRASSL